MARDSANTIRRERAILETRRRLTLVEIETHRIKAELARFEAENESEWAQELAGELPGEAAALVGGAVDGAPVATVVAVAPAIKSASRTGATSLPNHRPPAIQPKPLSSKAVGRPKRSQEPRRRLKVSPGWWVSLGLHAAVLAIIAPMTFVILTNDQVPLFASMFDFSETNFDPGLMPVELVSAEEPEVLEVQDAVYESAAEPAATSVVEDFSPLAGSAGGELASTAGQLNALPTDVGTLMAGGGNGKGRRQRGGRTERGDMAGAMGRTSFFGTPAVANRVVFLVDNSGSMKQGRMETTLFELAKSVDALNEKQEFYVVFYSDQAYPMLYPNSVMEPLKATRENKQRLYEWLHTVELCQGGALLKAIEIAKSLKPQVVYVLSDGDITGDVTMQRLTQANENPFAVHTLGMGVSKPQDAQNLAAIAQANHGTFQMVRPMPAAIQSAKQRPIRSNERGVSWGEGLVNR